MSFDGAGCLGFSLPFPAYLAVKIMKELEERGGEIEVGRGSELEMEIRNFFEGNYKDVPEIWHECFVENDIVRG